MPGRIWAIPFLTASSLGSDGNTPQNIISKSKITLTFATHELKVWELLVWVRRLNYS